MIAVGITLLKSKLSDYVLRAAAGETILITDRDNVVAELSMPALGRPRHVDDATLAALVKDGLVRPAGPKIYVDTSVMLAHLFDEARPQAWCFHFEDVPANKRPQARGIIW